MKTLEEVGALKRNWQSDPCWDIYATEGFEEYADELKAFQKERELIAVQRHHDELERTAERLGVPGNIVLARAFALLENKIDVLSDRLRRMELE